MSKVIDYQLVRSKRRTLGLEIRDNGELIVRAPLRASEKEIAKLLEEKQRWIFRHQTKIQERKQHTPEKNYVNGEFFRYLGELYPLWIIQEQKPRFYFDGAFYLAEKYQLKGAALFLQWYRQQAEQIIRERTDYYAKLAGLRYHALRINNPQRQWGACSPEGTLSFNWRLIMAPLDVIDYVVAHELAHLVWRNHSTRFWRKVAAIYPKFAIARKWLSDKGYLLIL